MNDMSSAAGNVIVPNSYQTPNVYVDKLMYYLTPNEWKVLSYACRSILGWQNKIEVRQARISLSRFKDGDSVSMGCGLSTYGIRRALTGLNKFGILVKVGKPTQDGQMYELTCDVNAIDWAGLEDRLNTQQKIYSQRLKSANESKNQGVSSHDSLSSHDTPVCRPTTDLGVSSHDNIENQLTENQLKTNNGEYPQILDEDFEEWKRQGTEQWKEAQAKAPKPPKSEKEAKERIAAAIASGADRHSGNVFRLGFVTDHLKPLALAFCQCFGRGPMKNERAFWIKAWTAQYELELSPADIQRTYDHMREENLSVTSPNSITSLAYDLKRRDEEVQERKSRQREQARSKARKAVL
jgi:hypothetical protein